jgi:hypothetical protein
MIDPLAPAADELAQAPAEVRLNPVKQAVQTADDPEAAHAEQLYAAQAEMFPIVTKYPALQAAM